MSSPFIFKPTKKFIFNPRPPVEKPLNSYREQKLSIVQKNFDSYKPVRPFNRFGINPIHVSNKKHFKIKKLHHIMLKIPLYIMNIIINTYQQSH